MVKSLRLALIAATFCCFVLCPIALGQSIPREPIFESRGGERMGQRASRRIADSSYAEPLMEAFRAFEGDRLILPHTTRIAIQREYERILTAAGWLEARPTLLVDECLDYAGARDIFGRITLCMGVLDQAETNGEIAFILAHELAHILLRHPPGSLQPFSNSPDLSSSLYYLGGRAAQNELYYYRANRIGLWARSESERFGYELEADLLAIDLLANAGYAVDTAILALAKFPNIGTAEFPRNEVRIELASRYISTFYQSARIREIEAFPPEEVIRAQASENFIIFVREYRAALDELEYAISLMIQCQRTVRERVNAVVWCTRPTSRGNASRSSMAEEIAFRCDSVSERLASLESNYRYRTRLIFQIEQAIGLSCSSVDRSYSTLMNRYFDGSASAFDLLQYLFSSYGIQETPSGRRVRDIVWERYGDQYLVQRMLMIYSLMIGDDEFGETVRRRCERRAGQPAGIFYRNACADAWNQSVYFMEDRLREARINANVSSAVSAHIFAEAGYFSRMRSELAQIKSFEDIEPPTASRELSIQTVFGGFAVASIGQPLYVSAQSRSPAGRIADASEATVVLTGNFQGSRVQIRVGPEEYRWIDADSVYLLFAYDIANFYEVFAPGHFSQSEIEILRSMTPVRYRY